MKLAVVNLLHELAEQIKVNNQLWAEAQELAEKHKESGLVRRIKDLNELNGDKTTRAYHTINEIERLKSLK